MNPVTAVGSIARTGTLPHTPMGEVPQTSKPQLLEDYGKLPLSFEINEGQTDPQVKFLSRGSGHTLFLTATEAVIALRGQANPSMVRIKLVNANPEASVHGLQELPGKSNYFIGKDHPQKCRTDVKNYAKVEYKDIYPGVNLIYYGNQGRLEHDFVVAPGTSPSIIAMDVGGAGNVSIDPQGNIVLANETGEVRLQKPVIYQEVNGRRQHIAGGYVLKDGLRVGFNVGAYDATRALVIDPVLVYSINLGGSDADPAFGIAVDSSGNAYVTGYTVSTDFPLRSPIQSCAGDYDVFVTKINATGDALLYSTYLGGSGDDRGYSIAVDSSGNAYVTGATDSTNFPLRNPIQASLLGSRNAFVTKINAAGDALVYSTYLGGDDNGYGIAVDSSGNAYVTGVTGPGFPLSSPIQSSFGGLCDAFVAKINAAGDALIYSTYLGGNQSDYGQAIAVDSSGNAYITGYTHSTNFPLHTPLQASPLGYWSAFVTKINAAGDALLYSTYLGGSGDNYGYGIAVDSSGNTYVAGTTYAHDFPLLNPIQSCAGYNHVFVTKIDAAGDALVYSTCLGCSGGGDLGYGIAVDSSGNAYVTGEAGDCFPLLNPIQSSFGGSGDAFVTKIAAVGALVYSTYLGSGYPDIGHAIAVDSSGNAYVTGLAGPGFPLSSPGQFGIGYYGDAFVAKIGLGANTIAGANITVEPIDATSGTTPAFLTFYAVTQSGTTSLTTGDTGPAIPSGSSLGNPPIYYDITTTAAYTPPVTVCISYVPAQYVDPSNLRLLHYENNAWLDVTTSHDITNHVIRGQVNTLSPFVVAQITPDTTPPVITPTISGTLGSNGWYTSDVTVSWTVTDNESSITAQSGCQTATVTTDAAGRTFTCSATSSGGTASKSVTIKRDATLPTITGNTSPAANSYGWHNSSVSVSYTCNDATSGIATCTSPQTLAEGANQSVNGMATDNAGNTASTEVTGINVDLTAPVVNVTGVTNGATYTLGSVPAAGCVTSDALSGVQTNATLSLTGGNSNGVGTFTASCTGAADKAGNPGGASLTYQVIYPFTGFFQPVDSPPTINVMKAGGAVPVKFSLGSNYGLAILAANSPTSGAIACGGGTLDDIEQTVTAGNSSLSYDTTTDQYIYVWKTDKTWSGTCRQFTLTLTDNTVHKAYFMFK